MQPSEEEVDFSKVFYRNNKSNTYLSIYADVKNSENIPGPRAQGIYSLGNKITPKSVVESVSGKLKSLQVSDSLKHRLRNPRKLHECSKSRHNIYSISKPVYTATKFETQDVSASQLLEAIDNAEELHNVASKGYTQEFEVSFQVENANVDDLEKAAAMTEPVLYKSGLNNELDLSQNNKLTLFQAETKITNDLPCVLTKTEYKCNTTETNTIENHKLMSNNKNVGNNPRNNVNTLQIEANCTVNDKSNSDYKMLNETYMIAKDQISDFGTDDVVDVISTEGNVLINKSEVKNMQNMVFVTETIPSPVFSILSGQEMALSPHIVCNLEDFEKFEHLAVSFNEYCTDEKENDDVYSQILKPNKNTKANKYQKNIEDVLETSDSLSEDDKALFENILHNNDNSNSLNISPVLPIQTITVKLDTELETLQSFSDMELTCKDTINTVDIIKTQNLDKSYRQNNLIDRKEVVSKQKVDYFLEDDILFSSDEEDEYIHKKINELPLTCALETSFYTNQSDALDKTMYVGFQTASNQYISVSTDSFSKAKSMMDDIDCNLGPSLLELVDKCEKSAIENKAIDNDAQLTYQTSCSNYITTKEYIDKNNSLEIIEAKNELETNGNFIEFKTASDKNINLTEKSRQRILKVFQDIDLTDDFTKEENFCEKAMSDSGLAAIKNKVYSNEYSKPEDLFTEIVFTDTEINVLDEVENLKVIPKSNLDQTKFEGFRTASDKAISISEKALQMYRKVFDNIDDSQFSTKTMLNSDPKVVKDDYVFKMPESPVPKTKNIDCLKTASNTTINVSNRALKVGFEMIDNINTDTIESPQDTSKQYSSSERFCGFRTASNKNVVISNKALEQSNKLFRDIQIDGDKPFLHDEQPIENVASSVCFKTANNKTIYISNKTIEKCRKVFENIDSIDKIIPQSSHNRHAKFAINPDEKAAGIDIASKTNFLEFQTASDKKINILEQSLEITKCIYDDLKELQPETHDAKSIEHKTPNFIGFQTANNKMINISKQLLEKTKHIFSNIDDIETDANNKYCSKIQDLKLPCTINKTDKDLDENVNENTVNYDENCKDEHENTAKGLKRGFKGFQTASNKRVKVSNETLTKTKDTFTDIINYNDFNKLEDAYKGFQTASNKKIVVSKDALAKTKQFFQDMPDLLRSDIISTPKFTRLDKKSTLISEEVQENSNKIFNKVQGEEMSNPKCNSLNTATFAGFQNGNKKTINVSEEALRNTKNLFDDNQNEGNVNQISQRLTTPKFAGFQTGNKKTIIVSEEALINSKRVFDHGQNEGIVNLSNTTNDKQSKSFALCFQNANQKEIQVSQKAVDKIRKDERRNACLEAPEKLKVNETNILLDTQAISNFENTLFTEDFCKDSTPIQHKRSGSPILSCPKAKRRNTFQTPYKSDKAVKTPKVIDKVKTAASIAYEFTNNNYKKNKTMNLKMLQKLEKECNNTPTIDERIKEINMQNILKFKFDDKRNDLSISNFKEVPVTVEDLKTLFLGSVDKKIVPEGWIENHLKLILWKLLSYAVVFPKVMDKVCTAKNVIDQLKYRYDRELYNVERPALRKILEKDELSSKCIVLCVINVIEDGNVVKSVSDINKTIELTVTDGWYSVKASIDKMLSKLVYDGKIAVGCKIITHGAELVNCDQGKSPLEDITEVRLKVFGNSTRLVRWHTKLGFFASAAILNRLSNVNVNGGKVSKLRVFVTRVYPMLYVEKFDDGSTVTRSERLETRYQNKYEMKRQSLMEKLYEEIETELSDEDSQDSIDYKEPSSKRKCLDSGSQLARAMKKCKDPVEFRSNLTDSQIQLLNEYTNKHRDRILQQIQSKIREKMEKSGSSCMRNVVPLLKVRVADIHERNGAVDVCNGYISIWRPSEAVSEIINEGEWVDVLNALPTAFRYQEIQLTAGRQTVFNKITPKLDERLSLHAKKLLRHCKEIKDLVKNSHEQIPHNEIDTIGIVTEIDPPNSSYETSGRQFQNVYLADLEKNMICINFWGGIKKFGFENILDTGQIVYGRNLQKRVGNTRKSIPLFRVTEFSIFTKTPKNIAQRNLIEIFAKNFSIINTKQFCEDCNIIRRRNESNKYNLNVENISPFRMNNSDYNLSKNRQYFESPLAQNNRKDEEFRLTGLDFESTFKQTDTQNMSPELLKKKRLAQAKIARLKMYGEPPPLSPIHILNKSKNATAAFKSPLINDQNKSIPTCSPKTTNEFLPLVGNRSTSPVFSSNASFTKKCLNPVKLNFNINTELNGTIDHFAGDFDSSPPLSLD